MKKTEEPQLEDPISFYMELLRHHPGMTYRGSMDRYRDFRELFLKDERGKRVLCEILMWGHLWDAIPSKSPIDNNEVMFMLGARNMALKIQSVINTEPKQVKPAKTRSRRTGGTNG